MASHHKNPRVRKIPANETNEYSAGEMAYFTEKSITSNPHCPRAAAVKYNNWLQGFRNGQKFLSTISNKRS